MINEQTGKDGFSVSGAVLTTLISDTEKPRSQISSALIENNSREQIFGNARAYLGATTQLANDAEQLGNDARYQKDVLTQKIIALSSNLAETKRSTPEQLLDLKTSLVQQLNRIQGTRIALIGFQAQIETALQELSVQGQRNARHRDQLAEQVGKYRPTSDDSITDERLALEQRLLWAEASVRACLEIIAKKLDKAIAAAMANVEVEKLERRQKWPARIAGLAAGIGIIAGFLPGLIPGVGRAFAESGANTLTGEYDDENALEVMQDDLCELADTVESLGDTVGIDTVKIFGSIFGKIDPNYENLVNDQYIALCEENEIAPGPIKLAARDIPETPLSPETSGSGGYYTFEQLPVDPAVLGFLLSELGYELPELGLAVTLSPGTVVSLIQPGAPEGALRDRMALHLDIVNSIAALGGEAHVELIIKPQGEGAVANTIVKVDRAFAIQIPDPKNPPELKDLVFSPGSIISEGIVNNGELTLTQYLTPFISERTNQPFSDTEIAVVLVDSAMASGTIRVLNPTTDVLESVPGPAEGSWVLVERKKANGNEIVQALMTDYIFKSPKVEINSVNGNNFNVRATPDGTVLLSATQAELADGTNFTDDELRALAGSNNFRMDPITGEVTVDAGNGLFWRLVVIPGGVGEKVTYGWVRSDVGDNPVEAIPEGTPPAHAVFAKQEAEGEEPTAPSEVLVFDENSPGIVLSTQNFGNTGNISVFSSPDGNQKVAQLFSNESRKFIARSNGRLAYLGADGQLMWVPESSLVIPDRSLLLQLPDPFVQEIDLSTAQLTFEQRADGGYIIVNGTQEIKTTTFKIFSRGNEIDVQPGIIHNAELVGLEQFTSDPDVFRIAGYFISATESQMPIEGGTSVTITTIRLGIPLPDGRLFFADMVYLQNETIGYSEDGNSWDGIDFKTLVGSLTPGKLMIISSREIPSPDKVLEIVGAEACAVDQWCARINAFQASGNVSPTRMMQDLRNGTPTQMRALAESMLVSLD